MIFPVYAGAVCGPERLRLPAGVRAPPALICHLCGVAMGMTEQRQER